jgi:hypothetical protein
MFNAVSFLFTFQLERKYYINMEKQCNANEVSIVHRAYNVQHGCIAPARLQSLILYRHRCCK